MQHTRRQILDCIKVNGGMSVDQLGRKLQVMSVTVRAHINVLERGNLVKGRELRTGRAGRPRIVYTSPIRPRNSSRRTTTTWPSA